MKEFLALPTAVVLYVLFGSAGVDELTYEDVRGFVDYVIQDHTYRISTDFCTEAVRQISDEDDSRIIICDRGNRYVIACTGIIYPGVAMLGAYKREVVDYLLRMAYNWLTRKESILDGK